MALDKSIIDDINNSLNNIISSKSPKKKPKEKEVVIDMKSTNQKDTISDTTNIEKYMTELNSMIGLTAVKEDINTLVHTIAINKERKRMNLSVPDFSNHLVFYGNPGTGKTTVARIIAKIYKELGVISKGQFVETDRSGLVAGYVGQTAIKTKELIDTAIGGVLFIDEAYSLVPEDKGNDFGQEAIDTLLKAMEDNRNNFIVIVAGYPNLMNRFINSNPGLKSRFNKYLYFNDYNADELVQIFVSMCEKYQYVLDDQLKQQLPSFFQKIVSNKPDNFANAREVRNIFEKAIQRQASRLYNEKKRSQNDMILLKLEDVFQNN